MSEPITLDFAARRRGLITIKVPEGSFPIDPNIDVEDMGEALVAEQATHWLIDQVVSARLGDKLPKGKELDDLKRQVREKATAVKDFILYLIRKRTPDAPPLSLKADEVLEIAQALSGNESITREVVDAITALAGSEALADASRSEGGPEGEAAGEDGEQAPLPSSKRSRKRSSTSGSSAGGRRNTGSGSRGGSSKRTSGT